MDSKLRIKGCQFKTVKYNNTPSSGDISMKVQVIMTKLSPYTECGT